MLPSRFALNHLARHTPNRNSPAIFTMPKFNISIELNSYPTELIRDSIQSVNRMMTKLKHGAMEVGLKRRLVVLAFADIANYSAMIANHDVELLGAWSKYRKIVIDPATKQFGGTLLRVVGDGLLLEFESATQAVAWAVAIQENGQPISSESSSVKIQLRIGINADDVLIDDANDMHGDGINIAARIHQAAQPGQTVITSSVREYIRNRLSVQLTDLGDQWFKNIARPIRIYRVEKTGVAPANTVEAEKNWYRRPGLAVLPFIARGPETAPYFGDGITEEIILSLSRIRTFLVISRNSSARYRERSGDLASIAQELGVKYLLDGSVTQNGDRLRISAQLIDASSGQVLWADRYDGHRNELFELQDKVSLGVVGVIEPKLLQFEMLRVKTKPTENLDAYDCLLKGLSYLYTSDDQEFLHAKNYFERAIQLDPDFAQAHAYLAWWAVLLHGDHPSLSIQLRHLPLHESIDHALALDNNDAFILAIAGHIEAFIRKSPEAANSYFERALALNENSAFAWGLSGITQVYLGKTMLAVERMDKARRLSPFDPLEFFFTGATGLAELVADRPKNAKIWLEKAMQINRNHSAGLRNLCACYSILGLQEQAENLAKEFMNREPQFSLSSFKEAYPLRDRLAMQRIIEALKLAGLPV
jgi:adenylate cyclase